MTLSVKNRRTKKLTKHRHSPRKHSKRSYRNTKQTNAKNRNTKHRRIRKNKRSDIARGICPNSEVKCELIDKHYTTGKVNETWSTCIDMNGINNHITYISSKNVIIKSVETPQVPEFVVKLSDSSENTTNKIMIEDKYIACFLKVCGEWYAIMRLFGKTLNTGVLARTEKNKVFYRIMNNINIDANDPETGSGVINIPIECYKNSDESPILSTSSAKVIELNDNCFVNINKENGDIFNVLQRFRQQKILGNVAKEEIIANAGLEVLEGVLD
jgi:hypothetical protein